MVKKFVVKEIENKTSKNKKVSWKTIRVGGKDNKTKLSYQDVETYYNRLLNMGYDSSQINIGVMGTEYRTMKGYNEDDLPDWDNDEYYRDRVKTPTKFNSYFFCDFMLRQN